MFFAPLLILLIPIALVLWPPSLVLTGLAWLLLWPFARGDESSAVVRAHRKVGGWFRTLLTPWTYFDVPKPPAGGATPAGGPAAGTAGNAESAPSSQADKPAAPTPP